MFILFSSDITLYCLLYLLHRDDLNGCLILKGSKPLSKEIKFYIFWRKKAIFYSGLIHEKKTIFHSCHDSNINTILIFLKWDFVALTEVCKKVLKVADSCSGPTNTWVNMLLLLTSVDEKVFFLYTSVTMLTHYRSWISRGFQPE